MHQRSLIYVLSRKNLKIEKFQPSKMAKSSRQFAKELQIGAKYTYAQEVEKHSPKDTQFHLK
jgi:hypothetical protein